MVCRYFAKRHIFYTNLDLTHKSNTYTAIPYRASTGPEHGFPCVVFPCEKNYTGKTLFSLQEWVCSVLIVVKMDTVKL
jgi:hypothetical protein